MLAGLVPVNSKAWEEMKAATAAYLATLPEGEAKLNGIKLGETVATRCLEARANDGSDALDAYRPRTTPGSYVDTTLFRRATVRHSPEQLHQKHRAGSGCLPAHSP